MTPTKIMQFALGPIGAAILGFATLPIITWFFNVEDLGRIAMLQVVLSFSTLFFSLGLDQSYVRDFHESKNRAKLFKTAILPGAFVLLASLSLVMIFNGLLSKLVFDVKSSWLSVMIALAILSTFISRFLSLILRMHERGVAYSMSQLLPKFFLLLIIGFYVLAESNKNLENLVYAYVFAAISVSIIFSWNTRFELFSSLSQKVDFQQLKKMLSFGLPLIWGGVAFWGLTATDKIMIRSLSTYQELGIYSVSVSFAAAAAILQSVFSTVWAPTVYKWASNGESMDKIHSVTRYILLCIVIIFCLAGLFSWLVTYLLPSDYANVQWILVSCLGFPLLYTISETTVIGIGLARKTSYSMLASFLALLVNISGNFLLIPIFGASGAAISTCIAFFVFFILRTEFSIYLWNPIPRLVLYVYTSLCVLGAVVSTLYGEEVYVYMQIYWLIMLLSCFLVFRHEFKSLTALLLSKFHSVKNE
ncbi:polysaccharide biosynthesis protein [Shewanella sp. GutCb]|uniref:oligosaccharide flippase family protein n=1 Tax=Shewanella sp. GutCb TaxID=2058315 RepID=UPI000C7B4D4A|nr:oligosaccharide flippase family protein [Shewanella sp. GutCb]PKG75871.1 polysaccharide biosynthesis protein [Shewanella sp. GutCb]